MLHAMGLMTGQAMSDSRLVWDRLKKSRAMPWNWDPILRRSMIFLAAVIVAGTGGYTWIEDWSPWRSFFFTLITLTTVGYGDYGLTPTGEKFTAFVMVGGIATVSYCLTQILEFITTRAMKPERKIMQQIQRLSGHHIVCGAGSMGRRVIERLEAQGEVVVAIDSDPQIVEQIRDRGLVAMQGDATSDKTLHDAGIERAKSLAAVTVSDAANALICLSAHAIAPELPIVARAEHTGSATKLRRAGAQTVISPTMYGGDGIAEFMARPDIARIMFGDGGSDSSVDCPMRVMELTINQPEATAGGSVAAFELAHPNLTVVAVRGVKGEFDVKPDKERSLGVGDSVMVAGLVMDLGMLVRNQAA